MIWEAVDVRRTQIDLKRNNIKKSNALIGKISFGNQSPN